jgi:eukaryotic-like serine/threonine-protein kinase
MLGAAIGRFRVQARLGSGSFGEVWLAAHEEPPHNRVTIKLFHADISAHPVMPLCFDEARTLSRVAAAGIAKIYDANHLPTGQAYMIQDYVEGESLLHRIAYGRHSSTQLADIVSQCANALVTAAGVGVFHNNLKPSNIFVVKDPHVPTGEHVVVSDFAHAKLMAALPERGSAGYMAPEQVAGAKPDWRIDAYSLGCIAFELGCQRSVFIADSWDKLRSKHVKEKPPNIRSFIPDATPALDRLVARMLEKNPAERTKSMKDISKLFQLMKGYDPPLGETVKD